MLRIKALDEQIEDCFN